MLVIPFWRYKMKRILISILLLSLLLPFAFAAPQPQLELTGKQMIPTGAPWIADDQRLYFGNDKNAYFYYDEASTDTLIMHGVSSLVAGAGIALDSGEDYTLTGGDSKADFSAGSGVTKTTTGAVTIGPGAVGLTGDLTIAATKGITKTAGAGNFDFSAGTGTFLTPTGAATLGGDTTVASTKTLAVTTADKLTVGGKIIPDRVTISVPITKTMITAGEVNGTYFTATDAGYKVIAINEVHPVAETTAATASISVMKITGTQAVASGTLATTAVINLKSTAETVVSPALSATPADYTLAQGNRLGLWFKITGTTTVTQLLRSSITITLERV
jgi:hypothetical protein